MNPSAAASIRLSRFVTNGLIRVSHTRSIAATVLLLTGILASGHCQDTQTLAVQNGEPVKRVHIMLPQSGTPVASELREQLNQRTTVRANLTPVNTGSGIIYTCDPSVSATICTYLNTTVAGYYNATFTNANANIYIAFGTTGLAESIQYYNFATYNQYVSALSSISNPSAVQTTALSALSTYDATPYGSGKVEFPVALGTALGFAASGMYGINTSEGACTPGAAGCYNGLVIITNDPGTPLYYDNLGGAEPADAYDYYGAVMHETDEVLGTSSCIYSSGSGLVNGCAFEAAGTPSAVDLFRYSAPHTLILASAPSTTAGAYFSYDGGTANGANGAADTPKLYNTLDNGADYADFAYDSDCGPNIAIQDAFGCPGADKGLTILNDGGAEVTILTAVGFSVPPPASTSATLTTPAPGSTLTSSSVKFTWTAASGATAYVLALGSTGVGSTNLYYSGSTTATSVTATGLPVNGETMYARLYTNNSGTWVHNDYTYKAVTQAVAVLTTPTPGSTLTSSSVTFTWSAASGATAYLLSLGSTGAGSTNLYYSGSTTNTSVTVNGLPINGETIYARLFTNHGGTWLHFDYTYKAVTEAQAVLTTPTPSSTLAGSRVTFSWTTASGATGYLLSLGSTGAGSTNLYYSGSTTNTSATVNGLPINGETIYARLFTHINGSWVHTDYTYKAATLVQAVLTTPTPGSTLTGSAVTFTWTSASGATGYILSLGSTGAGSTNLYYSGATTNTSATVTKLPTTGVTIYARLFTQISGTWVHTDYTYTAAP